jgi:hypothetical protein
MVTTNTSSQRKEIVLLISTFGCNNLEQKTNQERTKIILNKFDLLKVKEIDGSDPSNKELRNKLFKVSGIRGNYPQLFIIRRLLRLTDENRNKYDDENRNKSSSKTLNENNDDEEETINWENENESYNKYQYQFIGGYADIEAHNDNGTH